MAQRSLRGLGAALALAAAASAVAESGAVEAGRRKAEPCVACHGNDGNSPAPAFPKIAGLNANYLLRQLGDIQAGRREIPEMAGQLDGLGDADLRDIAAFYAAQTMSSGAADAQLVELGERVYRGGVRERNVPACIACHSPLGAGNPLIGFPRVGGQFAEYLAKRLRHFRVAECEEGEKRCMMTHTARQLTEAEIDAVASYASGLRE